jgi:hypothetical protein
VSLTSREWKWNRPQQVDQSLARGWIAVIVETPAVSIDSEKLPLSDEAFANAWFEVCKH